ncbi:MAG TPA: hypothetical protein VNN74_07445 [Candidatus Micrarchaeia archaeon]|nr:hypothetical protein [Candidatus Micrarchaeia archaeon]
MIDYGGEGMPYAINSVHVSSTTFTSTAPNPIGIYDPPCVPVYLSGNTFVGVPTQVSPAGCVG